MKVFVSGKIGSQGEVEYLMESLRGRGHEITFDWTTIEHLRPYEDNEEASEAAAVKETAGVASADVLILVSHQRGVGMFVELGVALALEKPVIVVTSGTPRTMFFFHPLVERVSTTDEVFEVLDKLDHTTNS